MTLEVQPVPPRQRRRETLGVALLFVPLIAALTWPHITVFTTHAVEHQDIYFNLWRLRWIAHALIASPLQLFDGNIFHPEPRALTLSDAMLLEGVLAAPFIWLGLPPMLVHNLTLWAALVGSACGIFVLARELTGSRGGALAAAIAFTFAPYRFDHYMHMELQWALWVPWAFWALHRTLASGRARDGALTGAFIALQMLSSIYYGIFLATVLPPVGIALAVVSRRQPLRRVAAALLPGVLLASIVCGAYAIPYLRTNAELGGRSDTEVIRFSARPSNYLIATPDNVVWGETLRGRSRPERRLFPGAIALALALSGLLLRPPTHVAIAYLLAGLLAFELSLGLSGYSFPFLSTWVPVYQGLRAIARAGLFVLFFVAILVAFGYAALAASVPRAARRWILPVVAGAMLFEYRVRPLPLVAYPNEPPPLHAWLATQPPGVVAELPMPVPEALPGNDPYYAYLSTFHWFPTLNGYSGYHPPSYLARADALRTFPSDAAVARLRQDGTRYVIVHFDGFDESVRLFISDLLVSRHRMAELARFPGGRFGSAVYAIP